jgi:hypothetical protein
MVHISKVTALDDKTLSHVTRFDIKQIRKIFSLYITVDKDLKLIKADRNVLPANKKTGNISISVILGSVRVTIFDVGKQ